MKTIAKIKYSILSYVISFKSWYKNLTAVDIMKTTYPIIVIFLIMVAFHAQSVKWDVYKQNKYVSNLEEQILDLQQINDKKDKLITAHKEKDTLVKEFVKELFVTKYYRTSLTGYHPVKEQTDSTPDITADGTKFDIDKAGDYRYVALSRDLLTTFKHRGADISFGDYILIKGTPNGAQDGIYQVRDTMNKRHTDWIDILLTPGEQSFYYKNILMIRVDNPKYVNILNEIYDLQTSPDPIAMVDPEV